jgi:predicted transcriptional regulator
MSHRDVYKYMLAYQGKHGMPPTMQEIRENVPRLHYRSSVRHTIRLLMDMGLVEPEKPQNHSRRYKAVKDERE